MNRVNFSSSEKKENSGPYRFVLLFACLYLAEYAAFTLLRSAPGQESRQKVKNARAEDRLPFYTWASFSSRVKGSINNISFKD